MNKCSMLAWLFGGSCLAVAGGVLAQGSAAAFPAKPVTIVLPYPPGGSTDPENRLYALKLTENTGQQFLVDNKPGAGTTIGTAYVVKSAPDGYTLLAVNSTLSVMPLTYKDLPFDTVRDLAAVTQISKRSSILTVTASLPVKTMQEYIAYARTNPGKINFGTSSLGGLTHLVAEWLKEATRTEVTLVPYKGTGPMTTDLVAGRLHAGMSSALPAKPFLASGKLKALGSTGAERIKALPDLPTILEQGVSGFDYYQWSGFSVPAATPRAVIARLNQEFAKVARDPVVIQKMEADGYNMVGGSPEDMRKLVATETERWKQIVARTGIKLEE
jgi:tripartite-type tricarboxylate transporter receptor subunit TctC